MHDDYIVGYSVNLKKKCGYSDMQEYRAESAKNSFFRGFNTFF